MTDQRFLDQSSNGAGRQGDYQFQVGYDNSCDYLVVLNRPTAPITTHLPKSNILGLIQEPPNEIYAPLHRGQSAMGTILNQKYSSENGRFILSPPLIPWFVQKSRPELEELAPFTKVKKLSCVTSKTFFFKGHKKRIEFLSSIQKKIEGLDTFGRGIHPIKDKWDGLAPYEYSIVMENFTCPYYWTEKIADCFLSWTYPIYFGCTNIHDFFPKNALMRFDMDDPHATDKIKERIKTPPTPEEIEAVKESRELILKKYHFFPSIAHHLDSISSDVPDSQHQTRIRSITIPILESWIRSYSRKYMIKIRGK